MKMIILLITLVALIAADFTPRMDQSCPPGQFQGRFWDGQKCEVCSFRNCYCNSYLGCDSCADQYSLVTPSGYMKTCLPCGPNLQGQNAIADGVKKCCFLEEGPDNIDPNAGFQIPGITLKVRPMRATQCYNIGDILPNGNVNTVYYQLFGSVCYSQAGCRNFTEYGKCTKCNDGYFLNENSQCKSCTDGNCRICLANQQCSICQANFFLATNDGKPSADADAQNSASLCKPCGSGCTCSGIYDTKLTGPRLCENCISDNYWFKSDGAGSCTLCSVSMPNCVRCSSEKKCLACSTNFVLNDQGTACVQCPDNCYQCSYISSIQKSSCATNGCFNGYFYEKSADGSGICPVCSQQYVIRCTGTNGKQILQCGDTIPDPPVTDVPHQKQKYLIQTNSGDYQCVPNSNNCKKMKNQVAAAQNGQCDSCYEDQGQYLAKKSLICLNCQTIKPNCVYNACTPNDQDSLDCTKCMGGIQPTQFSVSIQNYYLAQTSCVACQPGCLTCKDGTKCDSCQNSYFPQKDGTCQKCTVINCQDCTTAINKCNKCFPAMKVYQNFDGQGNDLCISCDDAQCLDCSSDRKTCNQCTPNYFVSGKVCVPTRKNCVQYRNSEGTCNACQYGYRAVDGWCVSCFSPGQGYINCQQTDASCNEVKKYRRDGDQYNLAWDQINYPPQNGSISMLKAGLVAAISILFMFIM